MKLEVRKVKVHHDISEETLCFSAELYDNGKLIGTVKNDGQGGSNFIYPAKGLTHNDVTQYENIDIECEIMELVELHDFVTKNQSKGFLLRKDDKYYTAKFVKPIGQLKKIKPTYLQAEKRRLELCGYDVLNRNV